MPISNLNFRMLYIETVTMCCIQALLHYYNRHLFYMDIMSKILSYLLKCKTTLI
jgi:hypothetical protein